MKKNLLLIGDPHFEPNQSLRRVHMLGRFMMEKKPDIVWCAGDWGTFNSLSPHEVGTVHNEGRRYKDDVDACNEALDIFHSYYRRMRKKPDLHICEGNHEQWIYRATVKQPELWGHITLDNVKFAHYGWNLVPFLEPLKLQGFVFKHYFTSGIMGRPIGGDNHAMNMIKKNYISSICGHSHDRHEAETTNGAGEKLMALNVGCYLEKRAHFTHEQARWWSGLTMLREAEKGYGSTAKYDFKYLKKHYL